jgi:hypothetical protein
MSETAPDLANAASHDKGPRLGAAWAKWLGPS